MGYRVIFDSEGLFLYHKATKQVIKVTLERGVFQVDAYIENSITQGDVAMIDASAHFCRRGCDSRRLVTDTLPVRPLDKTFQNDSADAMGGDAADNDKEAAAKETEAEGEMGGEQAGEDEHVENEGVAPKVATDPGMPTARQRAEHEVCHVPYCPWCVHCVRARGRARAQRNTRLCMSDEVEMIGMD